jgi:hypothetical protein
MGDSMNIEVISRLERLEARMRVVESRPSTEAKAAEPTAVVPYGANQASEIESLRHRIALTESKIKEAGALIPAHVEEELHSRVDDMRTEIETDLAKLNRRTIASIERGVDDRIGQRAVPIEKAVRGQAKAIEELRERVSLLENHLQRLVGTIERLVERPATAAATAPSEQPAFRTYLDHTVNSEPIPAPPDVDPLFRPRIIKEDDTRHTPPRRPMTPTA